MMRHKNKTVTYPRAPLHLSDKDVEVVEKELSKELKDREFFYCVPNIIEREITSLIIFENRKESDYFISKKFSHAESLRMAVQEFIKSVK